MTLEELYDQIGGSYERAAAYPRSERLVGRLVTRFVDDPACPALFGAWASRDLDAAFKAAHEAKGVCANLQLTELGELASSITELLRPEHLAAEPQAAAEAAPLVAELERRHAHAVAAIGAWQATSGSGDAR